MHANFHVSSSTGLVGERCDIRKDERHTVLPRSIFKNFNFNVFQNSFEKLNKPLRSKENVHFNQSALSAVSELWDFGLTPDQEKYLVLIWLSPKSCLSKTFLFRVNCCSVYLFKNATIFTKKSTLFNTVMVHFSIKLMWKWHFTAFHESDKKPMVFSF